MSKDQSQSDLLSIKQLLRPYTGWPSKNRNFFRYHIFAANTDIIMRFLLKCSGITAENKKREFF